MTTAFAEKANVFFFFRQQLRNNIPMSLFDFYEMLLTCAYVKRDKR